MEDKTLTVPVIEEEIIVEKTEVSDSHVEVRTWTELEKGTLDFDLVREDVEIERIRLDQVVAAPPTIRTEGETTIVPILEERIVMTKQLVLVEEVRMTRRCNVQTHSVTTELRKQRVSIERKEAE
jgi:uncharacterized protein (TIGR02271 family)